MAKLRERIPGLSARTMTRRAISVDARTPLAEALRRAHEVNARGIVLVDGPRQAPPAWWTRPR